MKFISWTIKKPVAFIFLISGLLVLTACNTIDADINPTNQLEKEIQSISTITIDADTTRAQLEAEYSAEIVLFKPEAGFAVLGFSKAIGSLSTLSGTANQDSFTQPEIEAQAFDSNGHSAWASGHSAWASGWSAWASGWSAWASGDVIPHLPKENQAAWDLIHLEEAHMLSKNFGAGSKVAVIDTGIDINHPVFSGRLAARAEWRDFIDDDNYPTEVSGGSAYGHGTGVAGIILQIAPQATILPIRVLDKDGRGDTDDVLLAIDHAINMEVDVINLSLGTSLYISALADMIALAEDKGIYVTSSSGNAGREKNLLYPSQWVNLSTIHTHNLNVGSVDSQGKLSSFTSDSIYTVMWGSEHKGQQWYRRLEQAAPGENIVSAYPGGRKASYTGTSFAAPMLAGVLALANGESSSKLNFQRSYGTYIDQAYSAEEFTAYTVNAASTMKRQVGWVTPEYLNSRGRVQTLDGIWKRSSGKNSSGKNNPKYSFSLSGEEFIAVDLRSSVDTYLYLLNSSGKVIVQDDNSGAGSNARIMKMLPQGSYTVVAATTKKNQNASFEVVVYGDTSSLK